MARLRKTLGRWEDPSVRELMRLMDSQSRQTICLWALQFGMDRMLPLFERRCPGDPRPRMALNAAQAYMKGEIKFPEVKRVILQECHAAARALDSDPVAQAAARACGQAASTVHTLSHALGLYFYGAAALAYDQLGLSAARQDYNGVAASLSHDMLNSLRAVAVEDEPNPAKIKWFC